MPRRLRCWLRLGGWGAWRVADGSLTREGTPLRVGLIQGNIAQDDKWNPREARRIFTTYIAMTRDAVRRGAEFVIWPESSTPFMFEEDDIGERGSSATLAREVGVPILFGSDQVDRSGSTLGCINAAFLVTADRGDRGGVPQDPPGAVRRVHSRKTCSTSFRRWWSAWRNSRPAPRWSMLPVGEHRSAPPSATRSSTRRSSARRCVDGSQLLTTITNDAWYGHSSAPYQHFALASMRAIEQGRYLARAANTGISGVVDPYGRVVQQSAIFEQAGLVEDVRS